MQLNWMSLLLSDLNVIPRFVQKHKRGLHRRLLIFDGVLMQVFLRFLRMRDISIRRHLLILFPRAS